MISISDITIMPVNTNTVVMKLNKKTSLTKISEKMWEYPKVCVNLQTDVR